MHDQEPTTLTLIRDALSQTKSSSHPKHKQKTKHYKMIRSLPSVLSSISAPIDGKQYSKREVMEQLAKYSDGPNVRSLLINELISNNLVPQSRVNIYRMFKKYNEGSLNLDEL